MQLGRLLHYYLTETPPRPDARRRDQFGDDRPHGLERRPTRLAAPGLRRGPERRQQLAVGQVGSQHAQGKAGCGHADVLVSRAPAGLVEYGQRRVHQQRLRSARAALAVVLAERDAVHARVDRVAIATRHCAPHRLPLHGEPAEAAVNDQLLKVALLHGLARAAGHAHRALDSAEVL
jgi:hypothetical protein